MPLFPASFNLSSLDGSNGYVLKGVDNDDRSGYSVSSAGDINGDGLDDVIIGAYEADTYAGSKVGESYVVYGNSNTGSALELSSLDGSNGYVLRGVDFFDYSGRSVSSAGDVNGDGLDDVIIGSYKANPNGISDAGESYVVFGSSTATSSSLDLSSLDGSNGFVLRGIGFRDYSGRSVSSAGDVNGDGLSDLIIGARDADPDGRSDAGESYVVFGTSSISSSLDLSSLDGSNGFALRGIGSGDRSGRSVGSAGDVNGDGIDDLIIGSRYADPDGRNNVGESYVVFGTSNVSSSSLDLSSLDGSNGYAIKGVALDDRSGYSVNSAGDVNGDGITDLIVSATSADPGGRRDAGESYVVFGSSITISSSLELSSLDGSNGYVIEGAVSGDFSGRSVGGVGDVNGDGIDDLIIGARRADPGGRSDAGESYVVFGSSSVSSSLDLALLDGNNGFVIEGIDAIDFSGTSVSGAGDVNGDGLFDLIVGARSADPDGKRTAGESYIIYGRANQPTVNDDIIDGIRNVDNTIDALAGNDVIRSANGDDALTGNLGDDRIYGNDGNDTLLGNEGADKLHGGSGVDILHGGDDNDILDGGSGNDTLNGDLGDDTLLGYGDNDVLNGGSGADKLIGHEGDDALNGGEGNDIVYGNDGLDTLNGDGGSDFLRGGAGNDTLNGGNDDDTLYGNEDSDVLNGESGADFLNGGEGNDALSGGTDNDRLYGALGDDTLNGDSGDDAVRGGAGRDTLNGGDGNDVLDGGSGEDTLYGDAGDDFLYGYGDNDTIEGGEGDDVVFAHDGDDTIEGGDGSDRIYAGAGNDTIMGGGLNGNAAEVDWLYGNAGLDTYVIGGRYVSLGNEDYAVIRGFNKAEDTIQLSSDNTYTLATTTGALPSGTGLYNDGDLVAVIESHVVGSIDLDSSYFTVV